MNIDDLKGWSNDKLKKKIIEQDIEIFNLNCRCEKFSEDFQRFASQRDSLEAENKALKHQLQEYKNIFESTYLPESAENAMRKTGLFTEEGIQNLIMAARQSLENVCDYEPQINEDDDISRFNYESVKHFAEEMNYKERNKELQDQHQQDCIKINDLTTTIHVLSGLYSNLRKNVGMD